MGGEPTSSDSMLSRRAELEQLAHERFASFLIEHGFLEEPTERDTISTIYYFVHLDRGIQITLEYREMRVELYLLRLIEGKLPRHGYILSGEVVRIPLMVCLHNFLHLDDEQISDLRTILKIDVLNFDSAVDAVNGWANVVERHLTLLDTQPLSTLFPTTDVFYQIMRANT
jgi:hypothetical protein